MIYIILAVLIFAFSYFVLGDKQKKYKELANNPSLSNGIFHKYSELFDYYRNEGMTIEEINSGKVRMFFTLDIEEYHIKTEIKVLYQSGNRLQFIIDIWLRKPVTRYIKGTSFLYSAYSSVEELIEISSNQIQLFLKNTLENLK